MSENIRRLMVLWAFFEDSKNCLDDRKLQSTQNICYVGTNIGYDSAGTYLRGAVQRDRILPEGRKLSNFVNLLIFRLC